MPHSFLTYAAAKTYTLQCKQRTPPSPGQDNKQALLIPLSVGLLGPDGKTTCALMAASVWALGYYDFGFVWEDRFSEGTNAMLGTREGRDSHLARHRPPKHSHISLV